MRILLLVFCVLILYAPIELTRVILDWEGFSNKFTFEIAFMWFPYVGAISILSVVVFRKLRKEQKT